VVDTSSLPSSLRATPIEPLQPTAGVDPRQLLLFEGTDEQGRLQALLGTVAEGAKLWDDPTTEIVGYGDTEIWEIYNTTADAHPMHLHLVSFQILSRQRFRATQDPETAALTAIRLIGKPTAPRPEENGWKDTAQMYPGEVTRVIARFDRSGEYVWHCHILSHEDHEMMRRFEVVEPFARELPDAGGAQASAALPELLPVQPNPFNPRTSVAFALPVAGTAELAVFNVRGERVRTLVREHLPAGSHAYIWNGCDDAGRPVASGIYYARLLSAGVQRAEPMTLAR
jgi:spore coat protein A